MGRFVNPDNSAFQAALGSEIYNCLLQQYTGNILLVAVNYDKKSKKHQCVIEKFEKGQEYE